MPKYARNCPVQCWASPEKAGRTRAAQIHQWYEEGHVPFRVLKMCREAGIKVAERSVYLHKDKHLTLLGDQTPLDDVAVELIENPETRLSDLEILERIIQKGASALVRREARVTPEMTMKALELKLKLTQGSVFDSFMGAVASAMKDEDLPADEPDPDA
jgi:hypothetical protein